jgi:hypothetical protein
VTSLTVTINGRSYGPREVRDELTMNDFLREYLGMTGTKFGCGVAQCLSCTVIVDGPDGSYTTPTCIVPAASFDSKSIRTVEGRQRPMIAAQMIRLVIGARLVSHFHAFRLRRSGSARRSTGALNPTFPTGRKKRAISMQA